MSKAIDLSHIYSLRNNFTIIGLTGQIGSGCSEVAEQLSRGFKYSDFEDPLEVGLEGLDSKTFKFKHNLYRKYRIVYNYAKYKDNFKGYSRINYKDVLMIFILQNTYEDFIKFLISPELGKELKEAKLHSDFSSEVQLLNGLKQQFEDLSMKYKSIKIQESKNKLSEFYFNPEFHQFCNSIYTILKSQSQLKRNKFLQIISTNLRKSGSPFVLSEPKADNIFTIVKLINQIIESHKRNSDGKRKERVQIVVDDLRSPIEIMYFKQQYAAFYTIAVTKDDKTRKDALKLKYNKTIDDFDIGEKLWEEEYDGGKDHEFYKAKISACIQQADIHISFLTKEEAIEKNYKIQGENSLNNKTIDRSSPYLSWKIQLLKYVSLISHPGLVTPSPEERCMQMAYTAKHNSGCISRHVGAAITDENYSIKAIGWNNTPAGQVPCVLRNTEDLLENKNDINSFTNYEKEYFLKNKNKPSDFFIALDVNFRSKIKENREKLKGRNVCFCFKDVKNFCPSEGKNQVHTRSLHAEESAFLQISKYGGGGIENGKLFTTASPCELCSKKAYQLGIKVIYYIDPYPGISDDHILSAGSNPIKPRLFNGVIGNAYHWLYDPIMPYKDELTLLLGNEFDDYATQQKKKADNYKMDAEKFMEESNEKDVKIVELEQRIQELEKKIK